MNAIHRLRQCGQSIWLDYIDHHLLHSGELGVLVDEDELSGVTSNPAIFEKAIESDAEYIGDLYALLDKGDPPGTIFEKLVIPDIRTATDILRPVYENTRGRDGYVSLEVAPSLAHDTEGTLAEARRLWREVGRENLMIKVPATMAGISAISHLIADGINVNVTLLFSQTMYEHAAQAYLEGLEQLIARGGNPASVASVASFFISRIDTKIDEIVSSRLNNAGNVQEVELLKDVLGKVAVANAKLAYRRYHEIYSGSRWEAIAARGAQTQRLLWASTGTKNPAYRDVMYIEELIGTDTVNTVPPATLKSFREHGKVRASLQENVTDAVAILNTLQVLGISLDAITDKLLSDGIKLFIDAYEKLLNSIAAKGS